MQNMFFKLFQFDFDRCFCTDRKKKPLARSFLVEQILNLFFWPQQAFKVIPYFPFTGAECTWNLTSLAVCTYLGWPRYRVRYKSDATSIRRASPLSTDRKTSSCLGMFLSFSFHNLWISNWNFSQYFLSLVRMPSQLLRGLSRRKLCRNLDTTAPSVWKQTLQKPHQNHCHAKLWAKRPKEMVSGRHLKENKKDKKVSFSFSKVWPTSKGFSSRNWKWLCCP